MRGVFSLKNHGFSLARFLESLVATPAYLLALPVTSLMGEAAFMRCLFKLSYHVGRLLAAVGIYGLIAYAVQQRTQEIGIRLALGAEASDVRNMMIDQGMCLTLIGVAIGVAASVGLSRFIASFLFGVQPWDLSVFVGTPFLLCAVALLAVWLPARRATKVDPIVALRYD